MKKIGIEAKLCAGCRNCELACSYAKTRSFRPSQARITVVRDDEAGMDFPVTCHQCPICAASASCPSGAFRRGNTGVMEVDADSCLGCGACAVACPFKAVWMSDSIPLVCDLCGGDPTCVKRCPTSALTYRETDARPLTPELAHANLRSGWRI